MAELIKKTTKPFEWSMYGTYGLAVEDEITETLKDGRKVTFVVMHKFGDVSAIGLKGTLGDHVMNAEATNEGGWMASDMRTYLNGEILGLLPDSLRMMIKPRVFDEAPDDPMNVYLWPFSDEEIFGTAYGVAEEYPGPQLDYFKDASNRIMFDMMGDPSWWWERSLSSVDSAEFCSVGCIGNADSDNASYSRGVCFGFYL